MKYQVIVTETVEYTVEVEAENVEEAEKIAEEIIINSTADEANQYFTAVTDRSTSVSEAVTGAPDEME